MGNHEIINKELILCKNNSDYLNQMIAKYKPFIFKYINTLKEEYNVYDEDLNTIGMLAFKEAIEKFKPEKGNFFSFAKLVIKSRTIDYIRTHQKKYKNEELISAIDPDEEYINQQKSIDLYEQENENELRKYEILEIKDTLSYWGITFDDIVANSPKKKKNKILYYNIAKSICNQKPLLEQILKTQRLPIKEVCELFNANRKKVERGRKYIIFLILIMSNDYPYIRGYLEMEC